MRKIRLYQITVALITVALGLFLIQCNIVDPQKGLEVRLNTISRTTTVTMFFYDAVSQKTVQGNLTATFKGDNSSMVIDVNNNPKTQFTAKNGFINFSIADGIKISKDNPLTLILNASSSGYNDYVSKVTLNSNGFITKSVYLTSSSTPPPNTVTQTDTSGSTDNTGTVTDTVNVSTENGTTVTINPGTKLTDASGSPVSGNLTTTITTTPVTGENSNIASQNFTVNNTTRFQPGMSFSVQIQNQSGQVVNQINSSQKIQLSLPLPADLNYQPGDALYVYAIDPNTGEPVQIGEGTVSGVSGSMRKISGVMLNGNSANVSINSLTYKYNYLGKETGACDAFLQSSQSEVSSYSFDLYMVSSGQLVPKGSINGSELINGSVQVNSGDTYVFKYGTVEVSSQITADCGTNTVTINLSAIPKTFHIAFAGKGVCKNTDPLTIGNLSSASYVYWVKGDEGNKHPGVIEKGAGSINIEPGVYTVSVTYQDETYEGGVTIGSNGELSSNFDTSGLYYGPIKINGVLTTLDSSNNPNIDGENVTVYFGINCD